MMMLTLRRRVRLALLALGGVVALSASPAHAQVAADMINLSQVTVYNSPADVASWPITQSITALHMRPSGDPISGVSVESNALSVWPEYTPPGWSGPLQYTVWAVVKVNGAWYTSGYIQMWKGRASTGAPIIAEFALNWAYDARWGPMMGHQPVVGEQMGFFLTAGDARGVGGVTSVRERTNVVLVNLPANDTGDFTFAGGAGTRMILTGDLSGDLKTDIIAQDTAGRVNLSIGNGLLDFTMPSSPYNNVVSSWNIVALGDMNGDGKKDLIWQNAAGSVVCWLNNGAAAPTQVYIYSGVSVWKVVAAVDLNHDGQTDLIWQGPDGRVAVWWMNGITLVSGANVWNDVSVWRVVGAGDFNGDGDPDLLWQSPGGALVYWLMHGTTLASAGYVYTGSSSWMAVNVGDISGDGKPDIQWRNASGQVVTWIMNGTTLVQQKWVKSTSTGWTLSTTP